MIYLNDYFDQIIERRNTLSVKWDNCQKIFDRDDILPMWVADSDWKTVPEVIENLKDRAEHGVFGYTYADNEIKESIVNWIENNYKWKIKKEWIVFDNGVVPALNFTLNMLTDPSDGVIIQPPVYRPFFEAIDNNSCELIKNDLIFENKKYKMDFSNLQKIIDNYKSKNRTIKAIILCSPHNPVGRVWNKKEINKLIEIAAKEDIYILSDEIHSDLTYPEIKHFPTVSLNENYKDKIITYMAPSKTFNIAGLHTSYTIISDANLRDKYVKTKHGFSSGNSPFGLNALKTAYNNGSEWLSNQQQYLKENLDYTADYLKKEIPEIKLIYPEGTYLLWLDCRGLGFEDNKKLIDFFNNKAKVGLNPGTWFGESGKGFMRMNIACPRSRLKEGLRRISNAVKNLRG
ncbi:MAG: MalY/PatB family protein [Bacillota bacterium]